MRLHTPIIATPILLALAGTNASAQSFTIPWFTIDNGGHSDSIAGLFTISGTIAQPDAASPASPLTGGNFTVVGGFWAVAVRACDADFNGDGVVNSQDFFDFLSAFFAADPAADYNRNGVVNSQDFFDFLADFFDGCA